MDEYSISLTRYNHVAICITLKVPQNVFPKWNKIRIDF